MLIRMGVAPRFPIGASAWDDEIAAERGRLLAAQAMARFPDQRKRVEDTFGVEYCKRRYPEVYHSSLRSGIGKLFDRMRIFLTT